MINKIWYFLAWLLSKEFIFKWLVKLAKQRPYTHIGQYMYRWWLIPYDSIFPFAIRIHHINRHDLDPYLHDHPWNYRTIVLKGWYKEEDVFGKIKKYKTGMTKAAMAESFHRIDEISNEGVWTLFITYKHRNNWGFMIGDPPRKIYHREYVSEYRRGD